MKKTLASFAVTFGTSQTFKVNHKHEKKTLYSFALTFENV